MKLMWLEGIALFFALLLIALSPFPAQAQGNDFEAGYLRTDQSQVYNYTDYRIDLRADTIPSNLGALPEDFTTAWLGVNVTQNEADSGFMQVGLMTRTDGLHWFAFGYMNVQCLYGVIFTVGGGTGCRGGVNDIVSLNQWHRVELVKYSSNNYWIARVYNAAGTQSWDVARFFTNVNRIYATYPTFEQGYNLINPHLDGQFWFRLPQYYNGGWQNWPYSGPNPNQHNYIQAKARNPGGFIKQTHCDGYYGVTPIVSSYNWEWYAGDGGADCGYILPPITYDDFNGALLYTGNWTHNSTCCPSASKGTLSWTNTNNDSVSLTASPADSITRIYTMAPNRGSSQVKINGASMVIASDYTPTKRWQVARTWSASGSITIEVSKYCCNYVDADAFLIDAPRVGVATYDGMHHMLRYIGDWTHSPTCCASASDGTLNWSNQPESGVTFTFVGDQITYVYTKHWNRGIAGITIDGVDKGTIDACSGYTQWQQSRTYSSLGSGVHTIHISNTGQSTCGSTNDYRYIDVDSLIVP